MTVSKMFWRDRLVVVSEPSKEENNIFSVFHGENGTGKSSALRWMICASFKAICRTFGIQVSINQVLETGRGHQETHEFDEPGEIEFQVEEATVIASFYEAPVDASALYEQRAGSGLDVTQEDLESLAFSTRGKRGSAYASLETSDGQFGSLPNRIVAVSSSQFDKFPILRKRIYMEKDNTIYFYRGSNLGVTDRSKFIKKKIDQLGDEFIDLLIDGSPRSTTIAPLLRFLGFDTKFSLYLSCSEMSTLEEYGLGTRDSRNAISRVFNRTKGFRELGEAEFEAVEAAARNLHPKFPVLEQYFPNRKLQKIGWHFDALDPSVGRDYAADLLVLLKYGIFELEDICFSARIETGERVDVNLLEASSGQLCVFFNFCAIASLIVDNSLILIDEPEVSLHPRWQSEFVPLLANAFCEYKGCHFILATHSPQVISSLPAGSSFAIDAAGDSPTLPGKAVHGRSADQLLAQNFRAPGAHNEYLIGQAINALTKMSEQGMPVGADLVHVQKLIEMGELLLAGDPAKKLLDTLKEAIGVLGRG